MISGKDIYDVLAGIVPLYVAMILAYGSVRWWKIFSPDQCSGINRFVAVFAVPLLSFHFISKNNPYAMNYRFIAADSLQKGVILAALFSWQMFTKNGSLEWMITLFSLSTLPNTLVMGIPLLKAMYGDFSASLMVQIVVLQSVIWYTIMLVMFEYRGAKLLISEQFRETAGSITSVRVDPDVVSLNGREPLQADAEIGDDGRLHVVVRRSNASSLMFSSYKNISHDLMPRASNLSGVEIYSVQSTPRVSNFDHIDFYPMFANKATGTRHGYTNSFGEDVFSLHSSKRGTPRTSNFEEELRFGKKNMGRSTSGEFGEAQVQIPNSSYPQPKFMFPRSMSANKAFSQKENARPAENLNDHKEINMEDNSKFSANGSPSIHPINAYDVEEQQLGDGENKRTQMPPASVMTKLIFIMVWRKLILNPNTYASLLGLVWSLISFRFHIKMPTIVSGSIAILSDAGLGMAMFSLGLFMALQPKMIGCGKRVATFAMAVRFLIGPAVIAATSTVVGLRGVLLHVSIVQAALPQGIVPFVFAKEYNVHADILSTTVIFGMVIALPITIVYYILLGL